MKPIAWLFKWILKAAIFFTLFAFALNNQGDVTLRFFFGHEWNAPMVLVVLGAFTAGLTVGVLGMVPRWWHKRHKTPAEQPIVSEAAAPQPATLSNDAYNDATLHGV